MSAANIAQVMTWLLASEGGYVDDARDNGGATNMGITIGTLSKWLGRPASKAEVRALSRDTAIAIYKARYWSPIKADDLPNGLDYAVFDIAVNSGPSRAIRMLQAAARLAADGRIDSDDLASLRSGKASADVIVEVCDIRRAFLRGLSDYPHFGRGWMRRVYEVEARALAMVEAEPRPITPETAPASPHPTLMRGDIDHDHVKLLQRLLVGRGWELTVDGYFGPRTEATVKKFQSMANLSVDGIVGPQTWAALER